MRIFDKYTPITLNEKYFENTVFYTHNIPIIILKEELLLIIIISRFHHFEKSY